MIVYTVTVWSKKKTEKLIRTLVTDDNTNILEMIKDLDKKFEVAKIEKGRHIKYLIQEEIGKD